MDSNNSIESLLIEAFLLSENLIHQFDKGFYTEKTCHDVNVPHIDVTVLTELIIQKYVDAGILPERVRFDLDKFKFQNEVRGAVLYLKDKNLIRVTTAEHLNTCWTRFVICKELCQIYIDIDRDTTSLDTGQLESRVTDLISHHVDAVEDIKLFEIETTDENYSEFLAFFTAIALVFPKENHAGFASLVEQLNDNFTMYDIAATYQMPEWVMSFFRKKIYGFFQERGYPNVG